MPAYRTKTITYDTIATEAFMSFRSQAYDQFYKSNPLFRRLYEGGTVKRKQHTHGKQFQINVNYARSRQTKAWDGMDTITPKRSEHKMPSHWNWANIGCPMLVAETDQKITEGAPLGWAIDILADEYESAMQDMVGYFSERLFQDGTAEGGKTISGLDAIVSTTPTSGTLAGIDRSTYTFWQNQAITGSISMTAYGPGGASGDYWMDLYYQCSDGPDRTPTLIVTDESTFKLLERQIWGVGASNATAMPRLMDLSSVDMGVQGLKYKNTEIIYDKNCPTGYIYFLSLPDFELIVDRDWDFLSTGWMSMRQNYQFADANIIVWRGEFVCTKPMFQGVSKTWS